MISGGVLSNYLPAQLSAVRFNNCTHSYSANILEITPSSTGGGSIYTARSGISLANDVITNTKPMAIVSLDGQAYANVAVLQLDGFNKYGQW